mgnify:CR=1 FL=1
MRALEPEDLDFIYQIENDETVWEISHTKTPYSRFLIRQYLENAQQDIYEAKQLRFVICLQSNQLPIGMIDLFDFDPKNNRAGIGIVIQSINDRNKNIGSEALHLMIQYAFHNLNLHSIAPKNQYLETHRNLLKLHQHTSQNHLPELHNH